MAEGCSSCQRLSGVQGESQAKALKDLAVGLFWYVVPFVGRVGPFLLITTVHITVHNYIWLQTHMTKRICSLWPQILATSQMGFWQFNTVARKLLFERTSENLHLGWFATSRAWKANRERMQAGTQHIRFYRAIHSPRTNMEAQQILCWQKKIEVVANSSISSRSQMLLGRFLSSQSSIMWCGDADENCIKTWPRQLSCWLIPPDTTPENKSNICRHSNLGSVNQVSNCLANSDTPGLYSNTLAV